jgi:hypothetical protein
VLEERGIRALMRREGNCWDNAPKDSDIATATTTTMSSISS